MPAGLPLSSVSVTSKYIGNPAAGLNPLISSVVLPSLCSQKDPSGLSLQPLLTDSVLSASTASFKALPNVISRLLPSGVIVFELFSNTIPLLVSSLPASLLIYVSVAGVGMSIAL